MSLTGVARPERQTATWHGRLPEVASALAAGGFSGLVAGGLGSRLAMGILARLNPDLTGVTTDAGATAGEFTVGGTLFLLAAGTALGAAGGLVFSILEHRLPRRATGLVFGWLLLLVFGGSVISDEGVDFFIFEPVWLGVGMFLALFPLYGLLLDLLRPRLHRWIAGGQNRGRRSAIVLAPLVITGPALLILVPGLSVATWWAGSAARARLQRSRIASAVVTLALATAGAFGVVGLGADLQNIF